MSWTLEALRHRPVCLYPLDGNYTDVSGYSRSASATGTPGSHAALAKGLSRATVFSRTAVGSFDSPVFKQGYESQSFALEASCRPIQRTTGITAQTYRENLVKNPSFETDASTWQVNTSAGGTVARTTSNPAIGSQSYLLTKGTGYAFAQILHTNMPVQPSTTYTIQALVRSSVTPIKVILRENGTGYSAAASTVVVNQWSRVSRTFTTGASTNTLSIDFGWEAADAASGSTLQLDAVMVEKSASLLPYIDGSMAGMEWSGTAHASTSRTRLDVSRVNIFKDSDAESGASWANQHGTVALSSSIKYSGTNSISATRTQAGIGDNRLGKFGTAAAGISVVGASTVYASVMMYSTVACNAKLEVPLINPSGVTSWLAGSTIAIPANTWTKVSAQVSVGTNVKFDGLQIVATSFANSGIMYGDQWFASVSPGTEFTGISSGTLWQGATNASEVLLLASDAPQQILGHLNQMDGLTISDTTVSFVTKYLTAPEARASYDLQQLRNAHIIGLHTEGKNSLFVDGELVAEVSLTEEQQADDYIATDGKLYSGTTISSDHVAVNGIGIYARALDAVTIKELFSAARNAPTAEEVTGMNDGDPVLVSLEDTTIFADRWWSTEDDWKRGRLINTVVQDDYLTTTSVEGVSVTGTWTDTFFLGSATGTSIYGVVLNWDGEGAVVQVSLDGTAWETVQRGVKVATVPAGFNPTDKALLVRVTFAGGVTDDTSYIDNLNVVGLQTGVAETAAGRTVTYTSASPEREYPTLQFHDNWGAEIASGGSLVISADSLTSVPARTLEVWIKPVSDTAPTFSISGTNYRNGSAATTLTVGEWTLAHIVASADVTGDITITGPAQIGHIGIYETALSADEIAAIYAQQVGTNVLKVIDTSSNAITETATAAKVYAHDWTVYSEG